MIVCMDKGRKGRVQEVVVARIYGYLCSESPKNHSTRSSNASSSTYCAGRRECKRPRCGKSSGSKHCRRLWQTHEVAMSFAVCERVPKSLIVALLL